MATFVLGRYSKVSHGYFFKRHSHFFFFSYDRLTSQGRPVDKSSLHEAKKKGVNKHFSDAHKFIFRVNSQGRKYHLTVRETNI